MERASHPIFVGCAMYYVLKYTDHLSTTFFPSSPPAASADLKLAPVSGGKRMHVHVEGENNAAILTAKHTGLKCLLDRGHKIYHYNGLDDVKDDIVMHPFAKQVYPQKHTSSPVLGIELAAGASAESFYADCKECKAATEIRYRHNTDRVTDDYAVHSTSIPWVRCMSV